MKFKKDLKNVFSKTKSSGPIYEEISSFQSLANSNVVVVSKKNTESLETLDEEVPTELKVDNLKKSASSDRLSSKDDVNISLNEMLDFTAADHEYNIPSESSYYTTVPNDKFSKTRFDRRQSILQNPDKEATLKLKRRTMANVIGHFDNKQPTISEETDAKKFVSKFTKEELNVIRTFLKSKDSKKSSKSFSNGFSIVYGIFLFLIGVFISLDVYAGRLGEKRYINMILFIIIYGISIGWIIYLYIDIRRYSKSTEKDHSLNSSFAEDRVEELVGKFVKARKKSDMNHVEKALEEKYAADNDLYALTDAIGGHGSSKSDSGNERYLCDSNAPYNLYLRVGIGAFCMITLIQCIIDIIEAIETGFSCGVETYESVISLFQFVFSSLQFLFIFNRANIVIRSNEFLASLLTMHVGVTNLIVWFKNILLETLNEYYEEELLLKFGNEPPAIKNNTTTVRYQAFNLRTASDAINTASFTNTITETATSIITTFTSLISSTTTTTTTTTSSSSFDYNVTTTPYQNGTKEYEDCYGTGSLPIQKFGVLVKPFLYPAAIEFSVICATVFAIMWKRIGESKSKHFTPLPRKNQKSAAPNPSMLILLDCSKTSRGLFCGILIFVGTIISTILFMIFNSEEDKNMQNTALFVSHLTESSLLLIALVITVIAYYKVRKHYGKVTPQMNAFDIVLEVLSMCGVYAFCINSLIALFDIENKADSRSSGDNLPDRVRYAATISSFLSIIQSTIQTFFILECLRRYANEDKEFLRKPARDLITTLLLANVSLWLHETFSAKRFDTNIFLITHFDTLRWSIISAFSSPLAIFYRFHSSVCLSDIWYGLYYGEAEEKEEHDDIEVSIKESSF